MNISKFFTERPIFAAMLSALIVLAGLLALPRLPISEYPDVVPPTVVVRAAYPGASPEVIAESVASPLEQAVNGVEGMLYQSSQATSDGALQLTVTFALGTDADKAQVQVQNRVSQAIPRLPAEVQRLGVTTEKSSPDLTMVVHLIAPEGRYDALYLSNFATLRVKDELSRIDGVGTVQVFGGGNYSMRVWLDPEKVASRGLTAGDVVRAIREQNVQVAAGQLGAPPAPSGADFQLSINTQGRLVSEEEFEKIVVRAGAGGELTRLSDVGRVELGADTYALRSLLDNRPAGAIGIFQRAGSNSIEISNQVRARMTELSRDFPEGIEFRIAYDPTVFVRGSIEAVVHTLFEAIALVVLVVILFLQTWRASVIPLIAVPVSLIGTFAVMLAFGFSLNALSLFGLVLAIGIVVDDAIVVVENVERNISLGLSPLAATHQAMREVTSPIIATALVLCAVFIPTAFITGLSGRFYQQFALTIAISTAISAVNSLTLSPALSAVLLRPHGAKKDRLSVVLDKALGWLFRPFNRVFERSSNLYVAGVGRLLRKGSLALVLYAGLVALTYAGFARTPTGFVPQQDKQYLVSFAQLPDAASLDRTEEVIKRMGTIALAHPGIESTIAFPGLSINGFTASPNSGIVFAMLKPFDERESPELSANAVAGALGAQFSAIEEAFVAVFPPPPVQGLGQIGGFKLEIQDRAGLGPRELYAQTQSILEKARQRPELAGLFSSFQVNVPQISADVDRDKAKAQGVALADLFETLQIYLGSLYVNDINRFGRTYQVNVQAEPEFRVNPDNITQLKTRNERGAMIPLGSFVQVKESSGPDRVMHYNSYPSAEINGGPGPGFSSGQAEAAMAELVQRELPTGMSLEWTELTYQQILAGNTALFVFPLCVLLVFVVLSALYESLSLPLVVILIVPMCLFSALVGVQLAGGDNNIFTQIGLIVLVGLACKNAILIVEFAREREAVGESTWQALLDACRLRLRPILMTSIAFIMGVVPLVTASGAGSEMRHAMGVAVFSGMLGVTFFGLLLTPVFYLTVRKLWPVKARAPADAGEALEPVASGH
jgi:multidrug efflux pump